MAVEVVGLSEALKALKAIEPDLHTELKKEITALLDPVVKKARGYVPMTIAGLSNWTYTQAGITGKSSVFRVGKFPLYNPTQVKRGIKSEFFPTRHSNNGFVSLVRVVNQSAAGAIFETAGRKNPKGQPWSGKKTGSHKFSHSLNPNAGEHFIASMGNTMAGDGRYRGRLIYRAWNEDQGRTIGYVMKAVERVADKCQNRINASKAFRKAA